MSAPLSRAEVPIWFELFKVALGGLCVIATEEEWDMKLNVDLAARTADEALEEYRKRAG